MDPDMGHHERDEWLMVQVAQGQREMLEPLIRRYGTPLLTFICRMVRDRQRSEDLFQDVFLAVWLKRAAYRFPRPFRPWLYKIAINRVRAVLRQRRGAPMLHFSEDEGESTDARAAGASPVEVAVATESATLVRRAVELLPPRQRMVVSMRVWNQLSYSEIAEALGVREVTVRSNMHDALATIRRHLEARV
jgi:RNA polymerase sigma-70 factor, ECF subfamily